MRSIPVFAGPSLSTIDRQGERFSWRGPAAAGDLIALLDDPPQQLCLIDGYFDHCAAPWHKEILLLMATGTRVLGAASMGAMRAAELAPFGMTGVGTIFAAYRHGRLTGDDEVALIHATERLNWAPLTVPMVEVRATLARACRARLLNPPLARRIRDVVHDLHFDSRDWPAMERICVDAGLLGAEHFRQLASAHVPLKRIDALQCLAEALRTPEDSRRPVEPPRTYFIRELARQRGVELRLAQTPAQAS